MATSTRKLRLSLYEEHLEEASFLYEQRQVLFANSEIPWTRLADFESRLEAHLDALVIGGQLALEVCRQHAQQGDAGELFAALCVYCRHQDVQLLAETWRIMDYDDPAKVRAVIDALKYEMPASWYPACERAFERGDERLSPLLAVVCGYRRVSYGEQIASQASRATRVSGETLWSLSRLPLAKSVDELLRRHCNHADVTIKANAHLGLLRGGQRDVLRANQLQLQDDSALQITLALGGDRSTAALLRQRLDAGVATPETLLALGILGDLSAVRSLTNALLHDELGESAATALYWITGAPLFENAFVAETVDEAALFEKELIAWRERRELPKRADGKPFGDTVQQLVREPAVWNEWLKNNAARFNADYRYRRGELYSARALLRCLLDESAICRLRQLCAEELAIRFGCEVPFETDMHVREQRTALSAMAEWLSVNESRFDSGRW